MLDKIIAFSVGNKLIILLFTSILALFGLFELSRLPIDAVPDITNNQVQIITTAPSYGATDIERLVTFPVEQATSNIPGMSEIRSYNRFGLSLVTVVFDDDVDIYWARQQVAERLQNVRTEIPEDIGSPELGPISTGLGEIYQYVVRPEPGYESKYPPTELRTIQDWIVRRQLLGVKGVAEVSSFGGHLKQYEIAVDPSRLRAQGLTITDLFDALRANNHNTGGAYIEKANQAIYIRSEGLVRNADDISAIRVSGSNSNTPILIRDVADVQIGGATRYGALTYNDQGEVAGAIVMMLKGGNSNVVIENIKEKIAEIQETLPEGVVIEPFLDRTKMVDNAISTVRNNLLEGALIVLFVLVIFLGNLRAGLLVASVIPLSMLFAVIMMNLFGVSGNLMSLGALDFGLIVDGAVIIVEAVMHQLARRGLLVTDQKSMDIQVKSAASKMMNSAVFGQLIILIVYLPIFSLEGIEGKMFKPMAQTVAFALLGAFILSLTYIPAVSALVLKKGSGASNFSDRIMDRIGSVYQRWLDLALRNTKTVLTTTVMLFVLSVAVLSRMGGEFIPSIEEGDYAVETRVLAGSNLTTTIENTQKVSAILTSRFPEIEKIVTKIGSSEIPTEPLPMDMGDMIITLKDKSKWVSAKTFDELSEKMGEAASEVPGVSTSFQFPVQMRFNELMTGARQDVVVKIFGEDLDTLAAYARTVGQIAASVEGTAEHYVESVSGLPQIVIDFNRALLAQHGINVSDMNQIINTAFAGQIAGTVYEGEKRFDLVVRLSSRYKTDVADVANLPVPLPSGQQIPLSQIASVALQNSPGQIQREDARRRILVGFNVDDRDVETIVDELRSKIERSVKLPAGYSITYGGAFENLNAAKSRLSVAVPVSLALIFILLYFAFGSVRQGLLIYTAIPLSAIGGILFLAARGMPFSISAGVGFIALFGIAVLNGIVLVAEFNRLRTLGETDLDKVVRQGTATRLRPVLMTAAVASLGFLPMAISTGAGGEVQRPLATVVIGGLIIATLLTLFVLPILYKRLEGRIRVNPVLPVAVLVLACTLPARAQQPISVQAAVDSAFKRNLTLQALSLEERRSLQLIGTSRDIAPTEVLAEYGKFNSPYRDSRFSITQDFKLPVAYRRQKDVLQARWRYDALRLNLTQREVRRDVLSLYYAINIQRQKEKVLRTTGTLYDDFTRITAARLQAGETNILENTNALQQKGALQVMLNEVNADTRKLLSRFQLLLNTDTAAVPDSSQIRFAFQPSGLQGHHVTARLAEQSADIAQAELQNAKSSLLPELSIGYNNLSIRDGVLKPSDRFSSFQAGIALPIFSGSQRARIAAAGINEQIARLGVESEARKLSQLYDETLSDYQKSQRDVGLYESGGLANAQLIRETLKRQLSAGEINYLEWMMLTQQALFTEIEYLNALDNLNQQSIMLEFLQSEQQ